MTRYVLSLKNLQILERLFTTELLQEFSHADEDDLYKYRYGMGTIIRVKILNPRNLAYKSFVKSGVTDREDMTNFILHDFHEYLKEKLQD